MTAHLTIPHCLPTDREAATLVGRIWSPQVAGPVLTLIRGDSLFDLSRIAPTMRDLLELDDPAGAASGARDLPRLGDLAAVLANSEERERDEQLPWFLAPCDLQALKASG